MDIQREGSGADGGEMMGDGAENGGSDTRGQEERNTQNVIKSNERMKRLAMSVGAQNVSRRKSRVNKHCLFKS